MKKKGSVPGVVGFCISFLCLVLTVIELVLFLTGKDPLGTFFYVASVLAVIGFGLSIAGICKSRAKAYKLGLIFALVNVAYIAFVVIRHFAA